MIKAKVADPKPPLSKIEATVKVARKTTGVNSKNMKPATILLLKLFPDKEMAKKFMMLNITNTTRRIINNWMPSDIFAPPIYLIYLLYSKVKWGTPLNYFNKRNNWDYNKRKRHGSK